jgi:hypothetical protein
MPAPTSRISVDLNFEKWPIWQPAKAVRKKTRVLRRDIPLENGNTLTARVTIGYIDHIGTLTTEDQRTFYGLIKLWEDQGKPLENARLSLRLLAKALHKGWGTNVIATLTRSLTRLRAVPLILEHAYYDHTTGELCNVLDSFTILSSLTIMHRQHHGRVTREAGQFQWNALILGNLVHHYTKPVLLEPILGFRHDITQLLYQHLDLVLAKRRIYERRTRELFTDDLGLEGVAYRHAANRAQKVRRWLDELRGVALTSGKITHVELVPTRDGNDHKIVIRKGVSRRRPPEEDAPAGTGRPEHTSSSAAALWAEGHPASPPPLDTHQASVCHRGEPDGVSRLCLSPDEEVRDVTTAHAEALLQDFYRVFHRQEQAAPTAREWQQALALITQFGPERARWVVHFVKRIAPEYMPQFFGGLVSYAARAAAAYDVHQQHVALQQAEARMEKFRQKYEVYREGEITCLRATLAPDMLEALEETVRTQLRNAGAKLAFGLDRATRAQVDQVLADRSQVPSFEAWCRQQREE